MIRFLLIAICLFSQLTSAKTSVWKVSKDNMTVYLGGTIHLLRAADYPLPIEYDKAYKASQVITFETDVTQLDSPELMKEMISKLSYKGEKTLQSEVSAETYKALSSYAQKSGLSLNFFRKAKPGMVMSTLMVIELQKLGVNQEGIDMHYQKKAIKDGKKTDFFESPQEQINFMAQIGIGHEDKFYQSMMLDFSNTNEQFTELLKYWRAGDSDKLDKLANQSMKEKFPKLHQMLLVDRNNSWLPQIENYFKTKEVEFVLVGAAHLIGEDGVIQQLKQKGYQVSRL